MTSSRKSTISPYLAEVCEQAELELDAGRVLRVLGPDSVKFSYIILLFTHTGRLAWVPSDRPPFNSQIQRLYSLKDDVGNCKKETEKEATAMKAKEAVCAKVKESLKSLSEKMEDMANEWKQALRAERERSERALEDFREMSERALETERRERERALETERRERERALETERSERERTSNELNELKLVLVGQRFKFQPPT
ncbi:unnamed protein product [Cyclocybe aegerita]|uniref:Uncharacterized protein n=1 Tax=Cyclocybe aegerita TaxID=1973307 RepID=A0A8S0WJC9_CYCAE|nr:unnamed protein product [Cyclocybe aegerita]